MELVEREVKNHLHVSAFGHPYIAQLQRVTIVPPSLALIMEWGGDITLETLMEQHGGRLPFHMAQRIFQQLVLALDFCARLGKCNRNVNPSNIYVSMQPAPAPTSHSGAAPGMAGPSGGGSGGGGEQHSGGGVSIKLSDFSYSKDLATDSAPRTKLGIALYTAPEIVVSEPHCTYEGEAADVWSCGVLLAMMLFGQHPFMQAEPDAEELAGAAAQASCTPGGRMAIQLLVKHQMVQMMRNSLTGQLQLPASALAEQPEAVDLIRGMLCPDPTQRVHFADVLSHPWVVNSMPPAWQQLNASLLAQFSGHEGGQPLTPSHALQARQIIQTALMMHRHLKQQQQVQQGGQRGQGGGAASRLSAEGSGSSCGFGGTQSSGDNADSSSVATQ